MENYFILLELPFDLPESDTNKISEAISKKQAQWSRDQSNPVKKAKASEYLAALEDIKKVMLRYFTCSALGHNHEGQPYEGKNVVDPVMWLLQQADSSIKAE